ncbi:hypothetical protein [Citrobacter portucalensis]|uniref:hypothetical protein n=1 Tax=Citrobacter portucalensis TaxID=1639133 RepID=UPI00292BA86D|nr:hypothetical protein [Citrobacter freundii]MDV0558040.1 hypothetical protein [Citrobacter portucalensis]MDV0583246.1 hypothetical protein [Citrobacter portucalensis]MEB0660059.1 hypothetical protein [Citrobacter portucalensis]MEB0700036.1 hypothetical protein [Citrobacter portucalensis]
MANVIIILLMVVAASANYLGIISYISLSILIVINLIRNKHTHKRNFAIVSILSVFLINTLYTVYSGFDIDPVVGNFLLQILFLLTLDYRKEQSLLIYEAIKWQVLISFLLGLIGFMGINNSMLIDAGSAKGFSGFYALTGIFATPQLLASACIALVLFQPIISSSISQVKKSSSIIKYISLCVLLVSLNRVNILFFISWKMISPIYKKIGGIAILFLLSFLGVIVFYMAILFMSLDNTVLQTVQSRIALISGVISTINFNDIWQVLFGLFNDINFYLPEYLIDISYIENGFLFIFKYFGAFGLIVYVLLSLSIVISLLRRNNKLLAIYAAYYLFIIQNFTNEFVSLIFPQIIYLLIYCAHANNRSSGQLRIG